MSAARLRPFVCLAVAALAGCGGESSDKPSSLDAVAAQLDKKAVADTQASKEQAAEEARAEATRLRAEADRLAERPLTEITIRDMQRGSALEGGGMLSTTLRGGIAAEQKLGMANVEHATNIYYGLEGKFPETHEEFMEGVIEFNQIQLEPLKEGWEYRYDPETHSLMKRPTEATIEEAEARAQAAEKAAEEAEAAAAEGAE